MRQYILTKNTEGRNQVIVNSQKYWGFIFASISVLLFLIYCTFTGAQAILFWQKADCTRSNPVFAYTVKSRDLYTLTITCPTPNGGKFIGSAMLHKSNTGKAVYFYNKNSTSRDIISANSAYGLTLVSIPLFFVLVVCLKVIIQSHHPVSSETWNAITKK